MFNIMEAVLVNNEEIEFNEKFSQAFDLLENSKDNLFITGKAGTGKSTLLEYFRAHSTKKMAVLAPTGVAAVNVKGQTIHSFFRFKPDITPDGVYTIIIRRNERKIYEKIETIVVDEISMVRADLLDCMDVFLRRFGPDKDSPFGGVQMVFIGDLYQLPPVVTRYDRSIFKDVYASPFFFDSNCYRQLRLRFIQLDKIYRQKEEDFIRLLGDIRNNTVNHEDIETLNTRCDPDFNPSNDDFYVFLTTTNALADKINQEQLKQLNSSAYVCEGDVLGDFASKNLPTHESLQLKIGAQVMLLNNDPHGRWVNGSIGKITYLNEQGFGTEAIEVELADGSFAEVLPYTWEMFKFYFNDDSKAIESESVGSFTQYPIRLAWAVTIHKSQGKTFPKVVIDIGSGTFSHGQVYVAVSRCTSFEGLVLRRPILKRHILLDNRVVQFMNAVKEFSL